MKNFNPDAWTLNVHYVRCTYLQLDTEIENYDKIKTMTERYLNLKLNTQCKAHGPALCVDDNSFCDNNLSIFHIFRKIHVKIRFSTSSIQWC